jgi:hypothetical protein
MNRREAIKGLGLSFGYAVATPAVISILQSCKNEKQGTIWNPQFLSQDEGSILNNLVDLILPKTENLPGASDINVAKFFDLYLDKVSSIDEQDNFKKGLAAILTSLGKPVEKLKVDDYDALLSKFLRAKPEEIEAFKNDKNEALIFQNLVEIRSKTILVYKQSEQIGENVLAYDPIPGKQQGCISLEEATGGRAWSL